MADNITVLIADDHLIFRQGLVNLLKNEKSIEIIGESGDGIEAFEMIKDLKPHVAIVDISMPGMDGLEIVQCARAEKLPVKFVILTMYREEKYFNKAMDDGVLGYLLKDNAILDLIACIKSVFNGKYYVSSLISEYMIHRKDRLTATQNQYSSLEGLTLTERKILKLIAENKTSNEIAEELFISIRTVQNHRAHICVKLNLKGFHKLLQFALENKSCL
jgi:DNA-binding NarL/FixJ family response regulator